MRSEGGAVVRLRNASAAPLLCLTSGQCPVLAAALLTAGANDVLPASAHPAELTARLTLDPGRRAARYGNVALVLTPREFAVLAGLARHPGTVCSRQMLTEALGGGAADGARARLASAVPGVMNFIAALRKRDTLRAEGEGAARSPVRPCAHSCPTGPSPPPLETQ